MRLFGGTSRMKNTIQNLQQETGDKEKHEEYEKQRVLFDLVQHNN